MITVNNRNGTSIFSQLFHPWIICSIGMLFYCYNYFLRVSPGVMQHDLMQAFHINAYEFGILASCYYWIYTFMQIPVGMIYDRFGARLVLFSACLTTVLGVGVFIAADTFFIACVGRFLIGLGTAFAYIGVLKLASIWLPSNRFAAVAGLTTAFGMSSAIFSAKYLTAFVQAVGYQSALQTALYVGLGLSLIILFFMQNKPKIQLKHHNAVYNQQPMKLQELFNAVLVVITNPQMWIIGIIGCLFYLPASVFLDAWGIPYLKTVYQMTPEQAASTISFAFIGWIVAGPTIGAISDIIKRRRLPLLVSSIMATTFLCAIFYVPGLSFNTLCVLFFLIGIFCGAHPLCFALGKENSPLQISGIAIAVTNTLIMLGGVIFHPVVGKLLDKHATVEIVMQNGVPVYSAGDYTYALSIIPISLVISIVLTLFLKETYCQSRELETQQKAKPLSLKPEMESI